MGVGSGHSSKSLEIRKKPIRLRVGLGPVHLVQVGNSRVEGRLSTGSQATGRRGGQPGRVATFGCLVNFSVCLFEVWVPGESSRSGSLRLTSGGSRLWRMRRLDKPDPSK